MLFEKQVAPVQAQGDGPALSLEPRSFEDRLGVCALSGSEIGLTAISEHADLSSGASTLKTVLPG